MWVSPVFTIVVTQHVHLNVKRVSTREALIPASRVHFLIASVLSPLLVCVSLPAKTCTEMLCKVLLSVVPCSSSALSVRALHTRSRAPVSSPYPETAAGFKSLKKITGT